MNPSESIKSLMQQTYLFKSLDDVQQSQILSTMRMLELQEGKRLFEFGQPAQRFYMLYQGQIKLFRVSIGGSEKVIDIINPGMLFAEAVMFMQQGHYPVSAEALMPSRVCAFDNQTLRNLLRGSTDACFAMLGEMSIRLHMMLNDIEQLSLQNATFRVVRYLVERLPKQKGKEAIISLSAPKNIIASRLSIQPETLSRIFHTLTRKGIISIQGSVIRIHDPARLRQFGQ